MKSRALEKKALELSRQPYSIKYEVDETCDGKRVYVLENPELCGCMAQGFTIEEALKDLEEVRYEYLLSILEDELPVPSPVATSTETIGGVSESLSSEQEQEGIIEELLPVIEPVGGRQTVTVSFVC